MSSNIKVVELFAGVGGFRIGLEAASPRYQTIWANQWEPNKKTQHAYDCYVANFGKDNHINADISTVKSLVPEHDLLVGGFPCQDYSVARTGAKGIEGHKGVLWWEIRDIVEAKQPQYILLENVDRLLKSPTSQRGRDFGVMLRSLDDLGYIVEWRVINAAEYGFAQRRRRIFIFATKQDSKLGNQLKNKVADLENLILEEGFFAQSFPVEDTVNPKKITSTNIRSNKLSDIKQVSDHFQAAFFNSGIMIDGKILSIETTPILKPFKSLRSVLENSPVEDKFFLNGSTEKWEFLKGAKRIPRVKPNGEPYFFTEGAMCFPDNLDAPARTMLTSESSVNRSSHVVEDQITGKLRLLTPIECERINGFPDNWTNTGMPQKFRYFVMGNALVVPIIEVLGKHLTKILD